MSHNIKKQNFISLIRNAKIYFRGKQKSHIIVYFCFLVGFNCTTYVISQSRIFGTLPILKPTTNVEYTDKNLNHTKEYEHILKIYTKLVNSRGDFRYPIPALYLREEEAYVASINYNNLAITIEKKAYDVCQKFGDIGIAFLLAHELTHYYEKHAWKSDFVYELGDLEIAKNLKETNDQIMNETQADYLGGFLAYSAGFGLFDNGKALIDSLYAAYKRPEKLQGYPSKSDRIKMAEKSGQKIAQLADIFEVANFMSAVGQYDNAFQLYKHILMQYQSRELYNNTGHAAVMNAMTYFDKDSLKYQYVSEIDLDFKGARSAAKTRDSILRQAIQYFDAAISLDPAYVPAYLNKANAYAMLNEDAKANFYLENEAVPVFKKAGKDFIKTESDIHVLRGILFDKLGKKVEAISEFDKAIAMNNSAAVYNKNVVLGITNPKSPMTKSWNCLKEPIGTMTLETYFRSPTHIPKKEVQLNNASTLRQSGGKKDFKIYNFTTGSAQKLRSVFLSTSVDYEGLAIGGIKKGSSADEIDTILGRPGAIISTTNGTLMVFEGSKNDQGKVLDENKIIFVMDEMNVVKKWIYYSSKLVIN